MYEFTSRLVGERVFAVATPIILATRPFPVYRTDDFASETSSMKLYMERTVTPLIFQELYDPAEYLAHA